MEVIKVLIDGSDICFIIPYEDGSGYFNWMFSMSEWNRYWSTRNKSVLVMREITKKYADEFLNDSVNDTIGCSNGTFHTIEECVKDFFK